MRRTLIALFLCTFALARGLQNGTHVKFFGATVTVLADGLLFATPELRAALNGDTTYADAPSAWDKAAKDAFETDSIVPQACISCSFLPGTMQKLATGTVYAAGSSHPTRLGGLNWSSGVVNSCRCLAGCQSAFGSSARGLGGTFLCEHGPSCDQCECFGGNSPLPADAPDCTGCGVGMPEFVQKC